MHIITVITPLLTFKQEFKASQLDEVFTRLMEWTSLGYTVHHVFID